MGDRPRLLLGIDLGTTVCRAMVASPEGEILGSARHEYPLIRHGPHEIEQHAQDWWRVASMCARQAIAESGHPGRSIRGVSVSSQGTSIVPVDSSGEVLRPAISWLDTRAGEELDLILDELDERALFQITGKRPGASYSLPKIMWLKKHEPQVFENTHHFLLPHDYLIYRLTGCFVTDHSLASSTLAHDVAALEWSPRLLEIAGIQAEKLPELSWAGTPVCEIIEESAETLGVSREAVVVCGGQDRKCAALGAGAKEGTVTVSLGTSSAITSVMRAPALDEAMRLPCFPFVIPNAWALQGEIATAGGAVKWFREAFVSGAYAVVDEMAQAAFEDTRDLYFYPHLSGAGSPIWKPEAPGVLYGISPSTSADAVARSVLEGVAYQIRSNLDTMSALGVNVDCVKVFGGGAASEVWLQMIADVLDREVRVPPTREVGAVGACVIAGAGSDAYASAEQGAAAFARGEKAVRPDVERAREYDERYGRYKETERKVLT